MVDCLTQKGVYCLRRSYLLHVSSTNTIRLGELTGQVHYDGPHLPQQSFSELVDPLEIILIIHFLSSPFALVTFR